MNTTDIAAPLATLLSELLDGPPSTGGYMLNRGDRGMVRSLDSLTASEASVIVNGGASIAAHVDHVAYGISLMNRWMAGENPWKEADWKASWQRTTVTDEQWRRLRTSFADESRRWLAAIREPRESAEADLTGMISSIVHLAYHLGAIRQMDRSLRGPSASNDVDALGAPGSPP